MSKVPAKRRVYTIEEGEDHDMFCDPCLRLSVQHRAHSYCTTCKESFCRLCITVHMNSRMSMNHIFIRAGLQRTDPNLFLTLSEVQFCRRHDTRRVKWYCEDHSEYCCSLCMKQEHRGCIDVRDLLDISSEQTDEKLANVKDDFKAFNKELEDTREKIIEERDSIRGKYETKIRSEIQKLRDTFNNTLDRAEKEFVDRAKIEEAQQRKKMVKLLHTVNCLTETTQVGESALKIINEKGVELQEKYACYGRIEQGLKERKEELSRLRQNAYSKNVEINYSKRVSGFLAGNLDIGSCFFHSDFLFPSEWRKPPFSILF